MATVSVKCRFVWLLLWLCVRLSATENTRVSMDDDVLLPYTDGHGPSHSHRHVRDCQSVIHGNTTHERWAASKHGGLPVAESMVFVSDVPRSSRLVYGHMTVVHDPLRTVSVLEPGGPGGCGMNQRATVEETAEAAGCLYAQNAGFFNTKTNQCLGNVVSNGRMVQDSGGVQNAQFGIRQDGTLVFGYLSQDDVSPNQTNPFVQLVSGVVWLLRNGEVYINESLTAECNKTQETGHFRTFVDVVSARTAVGHDAEGRLILFHIDGQTGVRGMSLWEVAEFLKTYGVINAINLDGGGSSTYVTDGSLASYPSDHCDLDNRWRCARRVSTILCVHPRRCRPTNCSGHGDCVDGRCRCHEGWQGAACDSLLCQPPACGAHGVCTARGCACDAGWRGESCNQECLPGFYGDGCNQTCGCINGGSCDPVHGRCACPAGFHGDTCEHAGRCLAKQMFTSWRQEAAHREQPHLTERTWLAITFALASLLTMSLLVHLRQVCGSAAAARLPERRDYSYVPLNDINRTGAGGKKSGKGGFRLDDLDSEEEIWTPSHSGRS
ncbi:N-acetylglucosamine-1-phosphodiester alpha-N-acetylglucosaminidase [Nibea albiflora]|nr:N-acetylglucosamine-1-phosphodiester alpha-N-acetylglucosaminidase [Nibea albiflora]